MTTEENTLAYKRTAELPIAGLWLTDGNDELVDLSDPGWSFVMRIGRLGRPAVHEKTSGLTAQVGSGGPASGVPNLTIEWDVGELENLVGSWSCEIIATADGKDRVFAGTLKVGKVVEPPTPPGP